MIPLNALVTSKAYVTNVIQTYAMVDAERRLFAPTRNGE